MALRILEKYWPLLKHVREGYASLSPDWCPVLPSTSSHHFSVPSCPFLGQVADYPKAQAGWTFLRNRRQGAYSRVRFSGMSPHMIM